MKFKIAILAVLFASGFAHADKDQCLNQAGNLLADTMDKEIAIIIRQNGVTNKAIIDGMYNQNSISRLNPPRWLDTWYEDGRKLYQPGREWKAKELHQWSVDIVKNRAQKEGRIPGAIDYSMAEAGYLMMRCGFDDASLNAGK